MKPLARAADVVAGQQVYADGYMFPPLWGPDSYNTGAGMARVTLAAGFIKSNMPNGITHANPVLTTNRPSTWQLS